MQRDIPQSNPGRFAGVGLMLVCMTWITTANASDPVFGYSSSYYYPYGSYWGHDNLRLQRKIGRMSQQMRRQQKTLDSLQDEQTRLLRQRHSAQRRVSAKQACYYRYDGGLDLCDRLFDATSEKHAACVETVVEMNPSCAGDIARASVKSGR